jgi:DNA-binding beta-propeller fold protein YncE
MADLRRTAIAILLLAVALPASAREEDREAPATIEADRVEVDGTVKIDGDASGSEFTADGRYGIVICRDSSELSIIDLEQLAVVKSVSFPEGSNPLTGTLAFGSEGDTFFVPLPGRDAVAVVSVPDFEIISMIPVGARPLGLVYLNTSLPDRAETRQPLGVALAAGRVFPPGCPDLCCGAV